MMAVGDTTIKRIFVLICIIGLFGIATLALAAATLGTLNKRFDSIISKTTTNRQNLKSTLAETILIEDLMGHLRQLQRIADESNGTRAINTRGFNQTIDYIEKYLNEHATGLKVMRETFQVRNFDIASDPILLSSINETIKNYTYSKILARSDFTYVTYSTSANFSDYVRVINIPNFGCLQSEWENAAGLVALVKAGGKCTYAEKGILARNNNVRAILFYNNGETNANLAPIIARLRHTNELPALYLSYAAGQTLSNATFLTSVTVKISIQLQDLGTFPVDNICADTIEGSNTEIIVVGSHSDSVPAGPGINDNGSGTAANLVLATNLARLYRTTSYTKYKYRVRFCWWGAEEIGLAGSSYHVQKAKTATTPGERLSDYLINLNFDMAGSPNFIFGIYDANTAPSETPVQVLPGSRKVTELYRDWFIEQNLPWDYRDFNGRSDYGPFLEECIAAGGVATGSDAIKTAVQREKYRNSVGDNNAGFAGAILDPCYHLPCDTIANIHQFGYENLIQAAAFGLEHLGQHSNLSQWLYPTGRCHI
ncbi:unnamed protein product [Rotaria magnacalcarata]|uniref:Peptide hydrolase n=2 Tax=Rotaria magnacalcarata TaxID=392030 RepID=A0A816Z4W6_9BILA|nr:unnamed protein product [Rotaria magnacalcarata]CAF1613452.1 unnamed protein product [Rotaria magnacalcarata]CAF1981708.1 unnamed protein product [Rotaria magnacalcarata]CAF2152606.1 unnamed protein product [Rotaria magnacalcarata]CAF2190806.1 unnamed protein product [Rotaria magnacalcarata]